MSLEGTKLWFLNVTPSKLLLNSPSPWSLSLQFVAASWFEPSSTKASLKMKSMGSVKRWSSLSYFYLIFVKSSLWNQFFNQFDSFVYQYRCHLYSCPRLTWWIYVHIRVCYPCSISVWFDSIFGLISILFLVGVMGFIAFVISLICFLFSW